MTKKIRILFCFSIFLAHLETTAGTPQIFQTEEVSDISISVKDLVEEYFTNNEFEDSTTLCSLMKNHGSDKGGGWHNYTTLYSKLFHRSVSEKLNIFELGLGTNNTDTPSNMGSSGVPGASLFAWSDYFTNSSIYGADIDRRILFSTERIKTYYCDQRDENSINELYANEDLEEISFDIILEDGLHEFSANHNFLIHSIGKLKKNGIFIVEDLNQESFNLFKNIIEDLKYKFSLNYINVIKIPNSRNSADNALLLIQK